MIARIGPELRRRAERLQTHLAEPIDATSFGVFRVVFGLVLTAEYLHTGYFRGLLISAAELHPWGPLTLVLCGLGAVSSLLLSLGLFTRSAAVLAYLATVVTFGLVAPHLTFSYHADGFLISGTLICLLCPVEQAVSLDRRRRGSGVSLGGMRRLHETFLIVVMSAVYLDAFTWKFSTKLWRSGLGVWAPISQPFATYLDLTWLGHWKAPLVALGYFVLAYQIAFPVSVWIRKLRLPLVMVGIGMHLSIGLCFPIPLFGLVAAAFYLPLVPVSVYRAIGLPASVLAALPDGGTSWRHRAVTAATALWIVVWPIVNIQSDFHPRYTFARAGTLLGRLERHAQRDSARLSRLLYPVTGIGPHPIFLDYYFEQHQAEYRVALADDAGAQKWIPLTTVNGTMSTYGLNRNWCVFSWFIYSQDADQMIPAVERLVRFYGGVGGTSESLPYRQVLVYSRHAETDLTTWQDDLLQRNRNRPWTLALRLTIDNGHLIPQAPPTADAVVSPGNGGNFLR